MVFTPGNFSIINLERVEIVRVAHSTLYGFDAMDSVLQIFTVRA